MLKDSVVVLGYRGCNDKIQSVFARGYRCDTRFEKCAYFMLARGKSIGERNCMTKWYYRTVGQYIAT